MDFDVRDTRNKNWLWMRREMLRRDGHELGAYGVAVYAAIASFAGQEQTARPSLSTVAEMLDCSRKTVKRRLNQLCELGWIAYQPREREDGSKTSHRFHLLQCPYESQSTPPDSATGGVPSELREGPDSDTGGTEVEGNEVEPSGEGKCAPAREEHPAVAVYHEVMPRRASNFQQDKIAQTVDDVDRWRDVVEEWRLADYNPGNLRGMLDVYESGWDDDRDEDEEYNDLRDFEPRWHG